MAKATKTKKEGVARTRKPCVYSLKKPDAVDPEKYRGQAKIFVQVLKGYSNPKDLATIASRAVEKGLTLKKGVDPGVCARYHLHNRVADGVVSAVVVE